MDIFHPDPAEKWFIHPDMAHRLAIAFGLAVSAVRADARDVAMWVGSDPELLAAIEHRRALAPAAAGRYLESLRSVLHAS